MVHAFLAEAQQQPGVLRAEDAASLARTDTTNDAIARRWLHSLPADLLVRTEPAIVLSWDGAQWVIPDGAVHRRVEANRHREFVAVQHAATVVEAMLPLSADEEALLFSRRLAKHANTGVGR